MQERTGEVLTVAEQIEMEFIRLFDETIRYLLKKCTWTIILYSVKAWMSKVNNIYLSK